MNETQDPTRCPKLTENGTRCVLDTGHETKNIKCRDWGAGTKWRERETPFHKLSR